MIIINQKIIKSFIFLWMTAPASEVLQNELDLGRSLPDEVVAEKADILIELMGTEETYNSLLGITVQVRYLIPGTHSCLLPYFELVALCSPILATKTWGN